MSRRARYCCHEYRPGDSWDVFPLRILQAAPAPLIRRRLGMLAVPTEPTWHGISPLGGSVRIHLAATLCPPAWMETAHSWPWTGGR